MGFFNAVPDDDGVVRRTSLIARCGGEYYKALSLAMYELHVGQKAQLIWEETRGLVQGLKAGPRGYIERRTQSEAEGGRVRLGCANKPSIVLVVFAHHLEHSIA